MVKGIILAGGKSSRLGVITSKTLKPLIKIGGKTTLDRTIQAFEDSKHIKDYVISINEGLIDNNEKVVLSTDSIKINLLNCLCKLFKTEETNLNSLNKSLALNPDKVIFSYSDAPFVDSNSIDTFIDKYFVTNNLIIPVVPKNNFKKIYDLYHHLFYYSKDFHWSHGTIFYADLSKPIQEVFFYRLDSFFKKRSFSRVGLSKEVNFLVSCKSIKYFFDVLKLRFERNFEKGKISGYLKYLLPEVSLKTYSNILSDYFQFNTELTPVSCLRIGIDFDIPSELASIIVNYDLIERRIKEHENKYFK